MSEIKKLDDSQMDNISGGAVVGHTALFDIDDNGMVHFQDNYGGTLNIPKATFEKVRAKYAGTGEYTDRGMEFRMKEVPVRDIQAIINNGV